MINSQGALREIITNTLLGTFEELDYVFAFIKGYKSQY